MQGMPVMRNKAAGQTLVETAFVIPLLILLIVNVVNFGAMFYAWISVANAARAGVEYFATAQASVTESGRPSAGAVQALLTNDLKALPNQSSIQVCVSVSTDKAATCSGGTAPAAPPAADTPEGSPPITYLIGAVDVSYTYQPIVPLWQYATLPPSTIVRRAQMRVLQ